MNQRACLCVLHIVSPHYGPFSRLFFFLCCCRLRPHAVMRQQTYMMHGDVCLIDTSREGERGEERGGERQREREREVEKVTTV